MHQYPFSDSRFDKFRNTSHKRQFLVEMESIILRKQLTEVVKRIHPKQDGAGPRPIGKERMLCTRDIQSRFNLSDPLVEEVLYESRTLCQIVGLHLGWEPVFGETTICLFRRL